MTGHAVAQGPQTFSLATTPSFSTSTAPGHDQSGRKPVCVHRHGGSHGERFGSQYQRGRGGHGRGVGEFGHGAFRRKRGVDGNRRQHGNLLGNRRVVERGCERGAPSGPRGLVDGDLRGRRRRPGRHGRAGGRHGKHRLCGAVNLGGFGERDRTAPRHGHVPDERTFHRHGALRGKLCGTDGNAYGNRPTRNPQHRAGRAASDHGLLSARGGGRCRGQRGHGRQRWRVLLVHDDRTARLSHGGVHGRSRPGQRDAGVRAGRDRGLLPTCVSRACRRSRRTRPAARP